LSEGEARTFLGTFGFQGDQALQSAETLSGGERARLALSLIVHSRPNLLLLDEPTNHLDITMRQALADALVSFEGALLVISHDRTMLRSVVDSLWLVAEGSLQPFEDDLDGYARWLAARRQQVADDKEGVSSKQAGEQLASSNTTVVASQTDRRQQKRENAERRARLAPFTKQVTQDERALVKAEGVLAQIREQLGVEAIYEEINKKSLTELLDKEVNARKTMEMIEERLLESMEVLEQATFNNNN
jgi:ATP-binding cassette subfamily F protein 3